MFYKHAKHSIGKVNISEDSDGTNIQLIFLTDSNKENKYKEKNILCRSLERRGVLLIDAGEIIQFF